MRLVVSGCLSDLLGSLVVANGVVDKADAESVVEILTPLVLAELELPIVTNGVAEEADVESVVVMLTPPAFTGIDFLEVLKCLVDAADVLLLTTVCCLIWEIIGLELLAAAGEVEVGAIVGLVESTVGSDDSLIPILVLYAGDAYPGVRVTATSERVVVKSLGALIGHGDKVRV